MAEKVLRTEYQDGSVVLSNIRNKKGIPIFRINDTYTATKVTTWYDGSVMNDSKADGKVYLKYKETGEYFLVNLPNWGETFLEKDTMAQMRALTSTEILLLKASYYKGVKLNGYYTKGDTPAPIEYFLSSTSDADNGGSIIEVGGIKIEHNFKDYIHISYFGALGDNAFDNTNVYNNIINSSVNNGIVEWPKSGIYLGHFSASKSLRLYGNGVTISNFTNTDPILRIGTEILYDHTTVSAGSTLQYGDIAIPVNNSSGISPGDIISLYDQKLRPSDNQKVNYETFTVLSVDNVNNVITIDDMVRSNQSVGTININLIKSPIKDVFISGFKIKPNNTHTGVLSVLEGVNHATVTNIETFNSVGDACSSKYSVGVTFNQIRHNNARLSGGGQGYGTINYFGRNITVKNLTSYNMRHSVDLSACYTAVLDWVYDYNSLSPIQLAHNTFGGNVRATNIIVDGQSQASLQVQGQGLTTWGDHIFNDLYIDNVTHIMRVSTASPRSVYIQSSIGKNVYIGNINVVNKITGYVLTNTNSAAVAIVGGAINGDLTINGVNVDKIAEVLLHSVGTTTVPNTGLINFSDIEIKQCYYPIVLQGTKRINIGNIKVSGAITHSSNSIILSSPAAALEEVSFRGSVVKDTASKVFTITPTSLLQGYPMVSNVQNDLRITALSTTKLTRTQLNNRSLILLSHNFGGNLNITAVADFLPDPDWFGETFSILVNTFTDFGTLGSIVIPSTNVNIINPDGGYGLTIRSGELLKFTGALIDTKKVWITERVNKNATAEVKGLVNQGVAVPNGSSIDTLLASLRTAGIIAT